MNTEYKVVTNKDIELIIALDKQARLDEPDIYSNYDEIKYRKNWVENPIDDNNTGDVILCIVDGDVVGRIDMIYELSYMDFSKIGYVDWVYTKPSYRGKGIGKQLLKEAEKLFIKNDCEKYYLFIAKNDQAIKFYDSTDMTIKTMNTAEKKLKK